MMKPHMLLFSFFFSLWCQAEKEKNAPSPPEAYTVNCQACHLEKDILVGPNFYNIRDAYPAEAAEYFVEWCVNPGKKRPEMPQMPSMAHIPKEQLLEIHKYMLAVVGNKNTPKQYAKEDRFPATERPRMVRTFIPEASPAPIILCLPTEAKDNMVWDTTDCRVRYFTKGEMDNWPYLRSNGNSLSNPGKKAASALMKSPGKQKRSFLGYKLKEDNLPIFLYEIDGTEFSEEVKLESGVLSLVIKTEKAENLSLITDLLESSTQSSVDGNTLTLTHTL